MWEYVTRGDARLADGGNRMTDDEKRKPIKPNRISHTSSSSVIRHPPSSAGSPTLATYAGIDRNTAERFRKGEMAMDGTIDLHGMSREKAHVALSGFIRHHYDRGSRCLLAITGKGFRQNGEQGRGILREMLPQWLAEPGLRGIILAFDVAKPKHGGSGAYYILLRRARNDGA